MLLTPPGMMVSPPAKLEHRFEMPIAWSVLFGSDLRRNGSILSMAAIVASDSTPSISVRVRTVVASAHHSVWSLNIPWKFGHTMPCLNGWSGIWIKRSPLRPRNQPRISPTAAANTCGGTTFSQRALNDASTKISARLKIPRKKTLGSIFRNCDGASNTMPQNSCASNLLCGLPKISGSCLAMISSPIDASIPSTTAAGKIALKRASLNLARTICTTPVKLMATSRHV